MSLDVQIGQRLRAARVGASQSLSELSRQSGIAEADLHAIEAGSKRIGAAMLYSLSRILKVEIRSLFSKEKIEQIGNPVAADTRILKDLRANGTLSALCDAYKNSKHAHADTRQTQ